MKSLIQSKILNTKWKLFRIIISVSFFILLLNTQCKYEDNNQIEGKQLVIQTLDSANIIAKKLPFESLKKFDLAKTLSDSLELDSVFYASVNSFSDFQLSQGKTVSAFSQAIQARRFALSLNEDQWVYHSNEKLANILLILNENRASRRFYTENLDSIPTLSQTQEIETKLKIYSTFQSKPKADLFSLNFAQIQSKSLKTKSSSTKSLGSYVKGTYLWNNKEYEKSLSEFIQAHRFDSSLNNSTNYQNLVSLSLNYSVLANDSGSAACIKKLNQFYLPLDITFAAAVDHLNRLINKKTFPVHNENFRLLLNQIIPTRSSSLLLELYFQIGTVCYLKGTDLTTYNSHISNLQTQIQKEAKQQQLAAKSITQLIEQDQIIRNRFSKHKSMEKTKWTRNLTTLIFGVLVGLMGFLFTKPLSPNVHTGLSYLSAIGIMSGLLGILINYFEPYFDTHPFKLKGLITISFFVTFLIFNVIKRQLTLTKES